MQSVTVQFQCTDKLLLDQHVQCCVAISLTDIMDVAATGLATTGSVCALMGCSQNAARCDDYHSYLYKLFASHRLSPV